MTAANSAAETAAASTREGFDELALANASFFIDKLGGECGDLQAPRELTVPRAMLSPRCASPAAPDSSVQKDEVLVVSVHQLVGELRNNRGKRAATRLSRPHRQPDTTSSLYRLGLAASPAASA